MWLRLRLHHHNCHSRQNQNHDVPRRKKNWAKRCFDWISSQPAWPHSALALCSSKFLSKLVRFRKIKFRTKILSLESAEKCAKCITSDLMVFIDSQRDSLVELSLNGYVIAETVTLMRIHLKDLLMLNCRISFKRQIFAVSSTLERLEFVNIYPVDDELEAGLCQLLRSCKGLRELYLGSVIRNDAITNTITNFLPKLKSLKIEIFEHFSPPSTQMVYKISRGIWIIVHKTVFLYNWRRMYL